MDEDQLTLHGATMAWEPRARLFRASYAPLARPRPEEAPVMQRWMDERAGPTAPFDMVVDLAHTDKLSIAWRYRWMSWFHARRKRLRVAIHHAGHIEPALISAFALSTRTEIRSFPDEDAALAWLRTPRQESI